MDKFLPVTRGCAEHSRETIGELVISCGDGAVDLEVTEHSLDAFALTVKPRRGLWALVPANRRRWRWRAFGHSF